MTVKQLIEVLQQVKDQDRLVILQKDAEGNGFSPLESLYDNAMYEPYNTWSGEIGLEFLTDELRKRGFAEEDLGRGHKALVLVPVN